MYFDRAPDLNWNNKTTDFKVMPINHLVKVQSSAMKPWVLVSRLFWHVPPLSWSVALCLRSVWDAPVATPPGWTITITPASHSGQLPGGLFNPALTDAPSQSVSHPSVVTRLLAKSFVYMRYVNYVNSAFVCLGYDPASVSATCLSSSLLGSLSVSSDLIPASSDSLATDTLSPFRVPRSHSDRKPLTKALFCCVSLVIFSPLCCSLPRSRLRLPCVVCLLGFLQFHIFASLVFPGHPLLKQ